MGDPSDDARSDEIRDGPRIATLERELARVHGVALEVNAPLSYTIANLTFALEELAAVTRRLADPRDGVDAPAYAAGAESALKAVAEALEGARNGADRIGRLLRSLVRNPTTVAPPRATGDDAIPAGAALLEPEPGRAETKPMRARVLVVDDEPMMVRAIQRLLENELDVVSSTDPAGVVARVRAGERFDVILCDLMMPTVSGIEVYEAIRAVDPLQAKRVVFMTGGAFTARVCQFLDATENARIEKPVERSTLLALVRSMLSS